MLLVTEHIVHNNPKANWKNPIGFCQGDLANSVANLWFGLQKSVIPAALYSSDLEMLRIDVSQYLTAIGCCLTVLICMKLSISQPQSAVNPTTHRMSVSHGMNLKCLLRSTYYCSWRTITQNYEKITTLIFKWHVLHLHLSDAFIQSNLQCVYIRALSVYSGYTFVLSVHVFPGNRTHNLCAAKAIL